MKKVIVFLIILCGFAINSFAQNMQEVVYLKNGSVVRGVIIEQIPNRSVKIKTADGSIFAYNMSEVVRITKEASLKKAYSSDNEIKKGYRGFVDIGYTFGVGDLRMDRLEFTTTHGYQFNPYLFAGLGAGISYWPDTEVMGYPLFVDIRTDIPTEAIFSPFVDIKLGFNPSNDHMSLYGNFSAGCRVAFSKHMAFNISLGFQIQKYQVDIHDNHGSHDEPFPSNGLALKAGLEF